MTIRKVTGDPRSTVQCYWPCFASNTISLIQLDPEVPTTQITHATTNSYTDQLVHWYQCLNQNWRTLKITTNQCWCGTTKGKKLFNRCPTPLTHVHADEKGGRAHTTLNVQRLVSAASSSSSWLGYEPRRRGRRRHEEKRWGDDGAATPDAEEQERPESAAPGDLAR